MSVFLSRRGGHEDGKDIEPVVQVLPECSFSNRFFQVLVGCRNDADIHADGSAAADSFKRPFLEDPQELGLGRGIQGSNFVKEEGAAVSTFKFPDSLVDRTCEGSLFVAEEFALDERFREGCAIQCDERLRGPRLLKWIALATSSFPVPLSPRIRAVTSVSDTRSIMRKTSAILLLVPTML